MPATRTPRGSILSWHDHALFVDLPIRHPERPDVRCVPLRQRHDHVQGIRIKGLGHIRPRRVCGCVCMRVIDPHEVQFGGLHIFEGGELLFRIHQVRIRTVVHVRARINPFHPALTPGQQAAALIRRFLLGVRDECLGLVPTQFQHRHPQLYSRKRPKSKAVRESTAICHREARRAVAISFLTSSSRAQRSDLLSDGDCHGASPLAMTRPPARYLHKAVDRYRSPPSGQTTTMTPSFSSAATSSAPATAAPDDCPTSKPSSRARRRATRIAPSDPSSGSEYSTSAPYARRMCLRSSLTLPGTTRCTRYPLAAPIIA